MVLRSGAPWRDLPEDYGLTPPITIAPVGGGGLPGEQLCLQRSRVPDTVRNGMVQLVVVARGKALRHRLNALEIAKTDQSRSVGRPLPLPGLMTQPVQERRQPSFEFVFPSLHGQPSKSQPPVNH